MRDRLSMHPQPRPRDLGDFQTPPALVDAVLARVAATGLRWPRVLEPTCGSGAFVRGLIGQPEPPVEIQGVEIQADRYIDASQQGDTSRETAVKILHTDLFGLDLTRDLEWRTEGPLLVVGNPPWVTSATLGTLGSLNHPRKRNDAGVPGFAAMTGASNFDLAEAVWIKLLTELAADRPTIALLGKLSVTRRVLEYAARVGHTVADAWFARIDARLWFGATVEAGLFCLTLGVPGDSGRMPTRIPVFPDLSSREPERFLGFARGRLVADLDAYGPLAFADGEHHVPWRQGVKHDAAPLMELSADPEGTWRNGLGETVDVEADHVFPLMKGTAVARGTVPTRAVLVSQRRPGEDTRALAQKAPRLWAYLQSRAEAFGRRKSSVYRDAPPFAMFGIGPYSFAPYKVAVSGLHRSPQFRAVGPVDGRPVLFDDTCYFLPFATAEGAALAAAILNGPEAGRLLQALSWSGGKRVVTKAALQRLDLAALLDHGDASEILARAEADVTRLENRPARWPVAPATLLREDHSGGIHVHG